ncbi:MAG: AraC family transcriptional regulator, partial [Pseudomonadales bacterium]|nr:AraC family transcriptional regulator [Pseudomonadales bacterium]
MMQINASVEQKVEQVAIYIEQHAEQKVSLQQLAEKFDISSFHLQRIFSKKYGLSPSQLQNLIRMQQLK